MTDDSIRNISDTAFWAASFRAKENDRPDALFRDPYAERLAGPRGRRIVETVSEGNQDEWAWITRTYLFDQLIEEELRKGTDVVINLAAGLDARPYRLPLQPSLTWIEVDLPDLLAYKTEVLRSETPRCALERVALDLSDVPARRELFASVGLRANRALIIAEGLIIYLTPEEAGSLAADLHAVPTFERWVLDIASPGLLRMLQKRMGAHLDEAGAPFKFGPEGGPPFFRRFGWEPIEVRSFLKTAARLGRLSPWMRLLALLPESKGKQGSSPWAAVCLLGRSHS